MRKRQQFRELLYRIELLKRKKVQNFLLESGLTPGQGQARILSFLSAHPGVTQREIADACMLDVTTMSRVIDRMQEKGLLKKERDPGCRRACRVELTEEGEEKAEQVKERFRELEDQMCSGIPDNEITMLIEKLGKIEKNLTEGMTDRK